MCQFIAIPDYNSSSIKLAFHESLAHEHWTGQRLRNRGTTFSRAWISYTSPLQSPEFRTLMPQKGQALSSFIHLFENITSTQLTISLCSWWPNSTWLSEAATSNHSLPRTASLECPGRPWRLLSKAFFMVHAFKTSWHSGLAEQLLCTCYEHGRFPGAPNVITIIGNVQMLIASPIIPY